jgi:hypothetical protein
LDIAQQYCKMGAWIWQQPNSNQSMSCHCVPPWA